GAGVPVDPHPLTAPELHLPGRRVAALRHVRHAAEVDVDPARIARLRVPGGQLGGALDDRPREGVALVRVADDDMAPRHAARAVELGRLGIVSYDPALLNTAACKSKISYIDGERGILRYRGYPIEELAEKSSFLETAYLVVKGELPTVSHFRMWQRNIKMHTMGHD